MVSWLLIGVIAWPIIALPFAVFVGKAIKFGMGEN